MKNITILLFILFSFQAVAQITVNRKIGQRWDKYINNSWAGQDSIVFNYNAYGLESDRFAEKGQAGNSWLFHYRSTSTYDGQQNLKTITRENWTNNNWVNITKYTYAYNSSNLQTEVLYQTWNAGTNSWRNTGRIINTYNSNQQQTKLETFSWDGSNWQPTTRQDFTYNSSNELINHELFNYLNSTFEKVERRQYQYAFGFVSSYIRSTPDSLGNWLLKNRTLHAINGSATPPRIATSTAQTRDNLNNIWVDSLKTSYTYTNNLLTMQEREVFNSNLQIWRPQNLNTYNYNGNNLLIEEKNQTYNQSNSSYQNVTRRLLSYNSNLLNDTTTFFDDNGNGGWKITDRDILNYNGNDSLIYRLNLNYTNSSFIPSEQYFYHFGNIAVGLRKVNSLFTNAHIYPNPATNIVSIQTNESINGTHEATIYSTDGKRIWSQINSRPINETRFNITALSKGNYILQITELSSGKSGYFKLSKL